MFNNSIEKYANIDNIKYAKYICYYMVQEHYLSKSFDCIDRTNMQVYNIIIAIFPNYL